MFRKKLIVLALALAAVFAFAPAAAFAADFGLTTTGALETKSGKANVEFLDDERVVYRMYPYDGSSVYLCTIAATIDEDLDQLEYEDEDDGPSFALVEDEEYEPVYEVITRHNYSAWMLIGPDCMEKGKDYSLEIRSGGFCYKVKWRVERFAGFAQTTTLAPTMSLKTEQTKLLSPTFSPANTYSLVNWRTSNKKVATVNSFGEVTGVAPGTCTITGSWDGEDTCSCQVTVADPDTPKLSAKSVSLHRGEKHKLTLKFAKGSVSFKTSDRSIATVSAGGTVTAKGIGSCTITAKSKGKSYTCKVKVTRLEPNFGAYLSDYDTRNNRFIVKVKNKGAKTLYIKPGYGKVRDVDYKSYDRTIYQGSNIAIAPGKSKTIYFKVQGSNTWYNHHGFTLDFAFTYDGKSYIWHTWDDDSVYKLPKGWYSTYWDEEWYDYWR